MTACSANIQQLHTGHNQQPDQLCEGDMWNGIWQILRETLEMIYGCEMNIKLRDIPAVRLWTSHSNKTCDFCGIELFDKNCKFQNEFF